MNFFYQGVIVWFTQSAMVELIPFNQAVRGEQRGQSQWIGRKKLKLRSDS